MSALERYRSSRFVVTARDMAEAEDIMVGIRDLYRLADAAIAETADYAADGWLVAELWKTRAEQADAENEQLREALARAEERAGES